MDQTNEAEALASTLVRLIEAGHLNVRVYTRGRLHAKAYIFDYGPVYDVAGRPLPRPEKGVAIVGSSNFSLSGVSHNTLRGLMRISLFKRFESSAHAFRRTLQRMLASHRAFVAAMERGIVPAGEQAQSILYESDRYDEQELFEALTAVSGRYKLEDFQAEALRADIEHDLQILEEMLRLVEPITPAEDAKLQTLLAWLYAGVDGMPPLSDQKCLIFTQYADTAAYLYQQLNPQDDPRIEVTYSQNKSKAQIVGRFSPGSNPEHRPAVGTPEMSQAAAQRILEFPNTACAQASFNRNYVAARCFAGQGD
jgi:hypothetical protein